MSLSNGQHKGPQQYIGQNSRLPKAICIEPIGPHLPTIVMHGWADRTEWKAVDDDVCQRVKDFGGAVYVRVDTQDEYEQAQLNALTNFSGH